jgi:hypothetical protein
MVMKAMGAIQNKKCEVAAVLRVKRLAPQTGVQLSFLQNTANTAYGGGHDGSFGLVAYGGGHDGSFGLVVQSTLHDGSSGFLVQSTGG